MLELKIDAARVNDDDGSRSVENVSISELEPLAIMTELLARADLDTAMEVEEVVVGIVGEANETQAAVLESKTGNMLVADEAGSRSVELAVERFGQQNANGEIENQWRDYRGVFGEAVDME